jgi:hypothetical protein
LGNDVDGRTRAFKNIHASSYIVNSFFCWDNCKAELAIASSNNPTVTRSFLFEIKLLPEDTND